MTSSTSETQTTAAPLPFGDALQDLSKLILIGPHIQATALKGLIAQQRELFDFMKRRCDADSQFVEKLGGASTMTDVGAAYFDFWRNAASQYAAEAKLLTERASQGVMDSVQVTQKQVAEGVSGSLRAAA